LHISELDIRLRDGSPASLAAQAKFYAEIAKTCLQQPACKVLQTWGFTDRYSWIGSHSHGTRGAALPFDRAYKPKAAFQLMFEEISAKNSQPH
jgi:endo-1,4-beta-xylanase